MNVVDSSGWLEYFADAPNADFFAAAIEDTEQLIVPAITLYEVFKRICQQKDENEALQAVMVMMQSQIIDLIPSIAFDATKLSLEFKLPMADSVILATAQAHNALLWTQDGHFEHIKGVRFVAK
ncbi:PIN domain-containing protein [bacterium]|nr:PIN domain-containing protein [bacterium]